MRLQASPPSPSLEGHHWGLKLTRLINFRICLLVGCNGLEADAAHFRSRTTNAQPGDPSCKLCNQSVPEDAANFMSTCPVLDEERVKLYSEPPPTVHSQIPDPRAHPQDFLEVMTGMCWVDDTNIQKFCIHFSEQAQGSQNGPPFSRFVLSLVLLILGQLSQGGGKKEEEGDT